jgi:hypothetical protein
MSLGPLTRALIKFIKLCFGGQGGEKNTEIRDKHSEIPTGKSAWKKTELDKPRKYPTFWRNLVLYIK